VCLLFLTVPRADNNNSFLGKAATADPMTIRSHFEELYTQKKDKQPDLDEIKDLIGSLLETPDVADKSSILNVKSDVCSKWHDFTELLIDLIVMQVSE